LKTSWIKPWRKEETMTLEAKERGTAREWAWPARLGTWLGQRTLADLVLEAVRKVGGEELNPPVTDPVSSAFHPKLMLAMLTYCYADGVYGSQDAEMMMHEDPAFRALCGMEFPDWQRLRRFRRYNHGVLSRTLAETFQRAWSLRFGGTTAAGRADGNGVEREGGAVRPATPLQQALIQQEVEARIERAMFIDGMASDF
jgi:hypothetical protein